MPIVAPDVGDFAPPVASCGKVFHYHALGDCPFCIKDSRIARCPVFRAGGSLYLLTNSSDLQRFYPALLGLVRATCDASLSIRTPPVFGRIPVRSCSGNVCNGRCLRICPAFCKGCRIRGFSGLRVGRLFCPLAYDLPNSSLRVTGVVATSPRCRAGASVLTPDIIGFSPAMSRCGNIC